MTATDNHEVKPAHVLGRGRALAVKDIALTIDYQERNTPTPNGSGTIDFDDSVGGCDKARTANPCPGISDSKGYPKTVNYTIVNPAPASSLSLVVVVLVLALVVLVSFKFSRT